MASSMASIPVLSMLPSLGKASLHYIPNERDINCQVLLDIAPDREALLISNKSTEEIRHSLKLRVQSPNGHWLHCMRRRQGVKPCNATARTSKLIGNSPDISPKNGALNDENSPPMDNIQIVRRVLSASAINTTLESIENRLITPSDGTVTLDIWGSPVLSTTDKLISPRPLGPTHILVVYAEQPPSILPPQMTAIQNLTPRRRNAVSRLPTLELPINDLLFVLNVPNLATSDLSSSSSYRVLPRRLHKELPRVLMHVPHLDTFPEIIVYLHTKNQAELFRKIVPEWMRDLMHPLPPAPSLPLIASGSEFIVSRKNTSLFGYLSSGSTTSSAQSLPLVPGSRRPSVSQSISYERERTMDSVAREISEVSHLMVHEDLAVGEDVDDIMHTVTILDKLKDNLEHVGFYGKNLWGELTVTREILIRAVAWKAKVGDA